MTLEQCWHRVPGGTATSALRTAAAIAALEVEGVEQVGVAAHHRHPPADAFRPPVPVRHLPVPRRLLYETWHAVALPRVELVTGRVDVTHATGVAVPGTRAPLVVTVHDLGFRHRPEHYTRHGVRFFERALELTRRRAALVLCPSEATWRECAEAGIAEDRLRVIPWGVSATPVTPEDVAALRARHGIPGRYVLWVGTIEPRKNLPGLLAAFRRLPDDVTLVLAGPSGWHEDLTVHRQGIEHRVRLTGFVSGAELAALYAGASVFCYPSLLEGFGMPVLEAMAQGAPVVTSSGTSTEEVAGDAGLVVPPTDGEALADALLQVLDDPPLADRLRAAGLARAATYTWERTARETVTAYQDVVR